jgi:hypothetical protein
MAPGVPRVRQASLPDGRGDPAPTNRRQDAGGQNPPMHAGKSARATGFYFLARESSRRLTMARVAGAIGPSGARRKYS